MSQVNNEWSWNRATVLAAGALCALLGAAVLTGWVAHIESLVLAPPRQIAMQPNTALSFLFGGIGLLLAFERPRASRRCGLIPLAAGAVTSLEYLSGIDLRMNVLLMKPFIAAGFLHPGWMAPNTAVLCVCSGIALCAGVAIPRRALLTALAGSLTLATGVVSFAGYLAAVPTYGWWSATQMAANTTWGFIIFGAGLIAAAWLAGGPDESGAPSWLPAVAGIACITATLCIWQALLALEQRHVQAIVRLTDQLGSTASQLRRDLLAEADTVLPEFALIVGSAFSLVVVAAVGLAQIARRRARVAEKARRDLEVEIAERKFAERQLGHSEEQRLLAMEAAGMGSWAWDATGGELDWGERGRALLGIPAETPLTPETFLKAVHPDDRAAVEAAILNEPPDGTVNLDFRVCSAGQPVRWLATRGRWRQPGRGVYGVVLDATERKLAEQSLRRSRDELEALVRERTGEIQDLNLELERHNQDLTALNAELEAFTYSVSHDLRAPLRHIDGFSKILMEDCARELNESGRRAIDRIRYGAQQMGRMIDDLLELSRMGRSELEKRPTDIRALVDEVSRLLTADFDGREIDLRIGQLPELECDPKLLKHVILNLLSNALKFTRDSKPAAIEIGTVTGAGAPAVFVRDNGVGFDMRYSDKLFGIFQRLHRREDYEGTGVGLATVQRIIHKHGGRVWAESELGKGATFYFTVN